MSKSSTVVELVCAQRNRMKPMLALLIAMGLLLALSALYVGPGDDAYPILVLDAVLVVGSFVVFTVGFWFCTKREMEE